MKRCPALFGFEMDFAGIRDSDGQGSRQSRRRLAGRLGQSFPSELVLRVEIKSRTKLCRRPGTRILRHQYVAMLEVIEHQLCFHYFARSQKLDILWGQTRRPVELREGFLQLPLILQLHTLAEGVPCFL